jgi:hypothetical protein
LVKKYHYISNKQAIPIAKGFYQKELVNHLARDAQSDEK